MLDEVEATEGDGRAKLARLFGIARSGGERLLAVELAIRGCARTDPAARARVRQVDERRMAYMRSIFAAFCSDAGDVEARCLLAFSLFIGSHLVAAGHGDLSRDDVIERAVHHLLA